MFDRLAQMEARYESLSRDMSDPNLVNDQKKFQAIAKEHRDMEPIVEKYRQHRKISTAIADAKAMLAEPDLKEMAQEELAELEPQLAPLEEELKVMLLPKDPNDDKNIVIELRAGTGGDEAALFVAEMSASTSASPSSTSGRSRCSPKPTPASATASRKSPRSLRAITSTGT